MGTKRIDRRQLVERHDPRLKEMDVHSVITIGNGNFCFNADITGLQTLYEQYRLPPLCTMSNWGWHASPNAKGGSYILDDVRMEEFMSGGRKVKYALHVVPGDEECYEWLRKNPHRLNLARIGLGLKGRDIAASQIGNINQRLHMYEGFSESEFAVDGVACKTVASVDPEFDTLAVTVASQGLKDGLGVKFAFPYGEYHIAASDWTVPQKHQTTVLKKTARTLVLKRRLDDTAFFVQIQAQQNVDWGLDLEKHALFVTTAGALLQLTINMATGMQAADDLAVTAAPAQIMNRAKAWWSSFWEEGGAVQLNKSTHPKALELERRIVQSQYIQASNTAGCMPPQETGLVCNSWYGKPHGEMYLWHCAHFPLWNRPELLERSLAWHMKILPAARENAARNGYEGARWPKMANTAGVDGPSYISPILIWQQPHLIYMLRLLYHARGNDAGVLRKYWPLIKQSADFLASFATKNETTGKYELLPPLLPSEERGMPSKVKNPSMDLAYWKFGLQLAIEMAGYAGEAIPEKWTEVEANMQLPFILDGEYTRYEGYPSEPEREAGRPSVPVSICGLMPGREVDMSVFKPQLERALNSADMMAIMGGWGNSNRAMSCVRAGLPELAIKCLLAECPRNSYASSGYNCLNLSGEGTGMGNLPVYLPGNGALLLVMPLMAVGYPGSEPAPGFPKDGQWTVETDGVLGYPF